MATFTVINHDEMDSFLSNCGFLEVQVPGTKERVYSQIVGRNLCIRVYTSVVNDTSRSKGKDAIRVCLVAKKDDGTIVGVGSQTRIHRVEGWRNNLQNRLDNWRALLGPKCSCGCHTVQRKSARGHFWGCSNYPVCKNITK